LGKKSNFSIKVLAISDNSDFSFFFWQKSNKAERKRGKKTTNLVATTFATPAVCNAARAVHALRSDQYVTTCWAGYVSGPCLPTDRQCGLFIQDFVLEFTIESITGVQIKMHGLGPLNWVGRMMVVGRIKKIIRKLLLNKTREEIMKVVGQQSVVDQLYIHVLQRKISRK
jgi:hypothetical protein